MRNLRRRRSRSLRPHVGNAAVSPSTHPLVCETVPLVSLRWTVVQRDAVLRSQSRSTPLQTMLGKKRSLLCCVCVYICVYISSTSTDSPKRVRTFKSHRIKIGHHVTLSSHLLHQKLPPSVTHKNETLNPLSSPQMTSIHPSTLMISFRSLWMF